MASFQQSVRKLGESLGVVRRKPQKVGESALADMKRFVPPDARPVILDVGANTGQSIKRLRKTFPASVIHSFEPSPRVFEQLKANVADKEDVFAWNLAMGATPGKRTFLENDHSDMSSFLELSQTGWGRIERKSDVEVDTVDHFLDTRQIRSIDILKSDTQGFDFEVIKGAEQTLRRNGIGLLYFEFIFSEMYKDLPRFDEVFRHLTDRNFLLVSIYDITHQNDLASWTDALFINREYYARRPKAT